jgi:hypothetical protein
MNDPEESEELTDRDIQVLDFIRRSANCTKQEVVDYMDSKDLPIELRSSRPTVWKSIDKLIRNKNVRQYHDEKNRQTKRLVIVETNMYNRYLGLLASFERTFFLLLSKLEKVLKDQGLFSPGTDKAVEIIALMRSIFDIFYLLVNTLLLQARSHWFYMFADPEQLKNLYALVFSKLANMQFRLFKRWKKFDPTKTLENMELDEERKIGIRTLDLKVRNQAIWKKFAIYDEAAKVWDIVADFKFNPDIRLLSKFIEQDGEKKDIKPLS